MGGSDGRGAGSGSVLGGFRIVRELGRGGFGVVYEAHQVDLGRRVALKVYHASFSVGDRERGKFEREARVAAHVQHPNIIPIYKVGDVDGIPYLAMEFVEGCSLDKVVAELRGRDLTGLRRSTFLEAVRTVLRRETGRAPPTPAAPEAEDPSHVETAVGLVLQAAEALAAAHEQGVVHRDVKPANLLVRTDGHLFVSDFGLARDETLATLTRTGYFRGTPQYLSPEQTLAERQAVDHRTDVYSLGATLYELLTLRPLHAGTTTTEILHSIVFGRSTPIERCNPQVPRDLALILEHATARHPGDRYARMADFAADLRRFLDHEAISIRPVGRAARGLRWARHHPRTSAAALLVLLGAGAGTVVLAQEAESSRAAATAARASERDRLTRTLGEAASLLDLGRAEDARVALSPLLATQPDDPEVRTLATAVRDALSSRLASHLEAVEVPPDRLVPEAALSAARALEEIVRVEPALAGEVGARLEAARGRVRRLEAALAVHPSMAGIFGADADRVLVALQELAAVLLGSSRGSPSVQAYGPAEAAGESARPGEGLTPWAFPGPVPRRGGVVFGGYAIDSDSPPYRDLLGVDVAGKFVLCFSGGPRFGGGRNPFGDRSAQEQHADLVRKAEVVHRAAGIGLLVVGRKEGEEVVRPADGVLHDSPVPIVHVRRDLAVRWLASGERDLDRVGAEIDRTLRPGAFPIPGLEIVVDRTPVPGSPRVLSPAMVPFLEPLTTAESHEMVRRIALGLLVSVPGPESEAVLRRALTSGIDADRACIAMRLLLEGRAGLEPELEATLAAWHEDPRAHLAFRQYGTAWEGNSGLSLDAPLPDLEIGLPGDAGRLWSVETPLEPTNLMAWSVPTSATGHVLAALWRLTPERASRLARAWVLEGEWTAAEVLVRAGDSQALDLIAQALQRLPPPPRDPSLVEEEIGDVLEDEHEIFRAVGANHLARRGDRRAIPHLLRSLSDRPTYVAYGALLEALGRFQGAEGVQELLGIALDRDSSYRTEAVRVLRVGARFEAARPGLLAALADESDPRILLGLELLAYAPGRPPLGTELEARVAALLEVPDARIRWRALLAHESPAGKAGDTARAGLAADPEAAVPIVRGWLAALAGKWKESPATPEEALDALGLLAQVLPLDRSADNNPLFAAISAGVTTPEAQAAARPTIESMLERKEHDELADALGLVGHLPDGLRRSESIASRVRAHLQEEDRRIRILAVYALGGLDEETAAVAAEALGGDYGAWTAEWLSGGRNLEKLLDPGSAAIRDRLFPGPRVSDPFAQAFLQGLARAEMAGWPETALAEAVRLVERLERPPRREWAEPANEAAWSMVRPDEPVAGTEVLALVLAEIAVEASERKKAHVLDTLAVALAANGRHSEAIAVQREAISRADPTDGNLTEYRDRLRELERAASGSAPR